MNQATKKKGPISRSKVVKLPAKSVKKKLVDPIGEILEKEIDFRGMTVAAWARQQKIPRSRVYKWFGGSAPKHPDRLKIDAWLNGGDSKTLQQQVNDLHAENKAIIHQLAKLMVKGTTQSVADAMASLKADIELAKNDVK